MLELIECRVTLKYLFQQAQAGARCGDGKLRVQWDNYQVSHAVPLHLAPWQRIVRTQTGTLCEY